jgi:hypothetical protein
MTLMLLSWTLAVLGLCGCGLAGHVYNEAVLSLNRWPMPRGGASPAWRSRMRIKSSASTSLSRLAHEIVSEASGHGRATTSIRTLANHYFGG